MPKKFMGFDISYLKKEYMEPKRSKMSKHEKSEHRAANALLRKLKKSR